MGRIRRFIVEYVGNLHFSHRVERRGNRHARDLVHWIEEQMEARGFPSSKKRELIQDLRQAFRQDGAAEEPVPELVRETKGVSRDAPS